MEAENAAVVEAQTQVHRIAHESKALTNELVMALEAIADNTNGISNPAKRKAPARSTRAANSSSITSSQCSEPFIGSMEMTSPRVELACADTDSSVPVKAKRNLWHVVERKSIRCSLLS